MKTAREKIEYDCKKATFLIERSQGEVLTKREKLELKIHLTGCFICRTYQQQSLLISAMMRNFLAINTPLDIKLSDEFKKNLAAQITGKISG